MDLIWNIFWRCRDRSFRSRLTEKTTEGKMMKAGVTEIGKTLAEKILFCANNWQCKICCNVNWVRRSECNMCNTPKFAKHEERTGYGAGFNERENDKYSGNPGSKSSLKENFKKEDDGEEEGDLSKYKLDVRT
uniref:RanBP2-type domain-containing protein n=1 Tax=Oncorhynchus tshawytscha TaxID=74940 RepID=A0A8C8C299_ONCTS